MNQNVNQKFQQINEEIEYFAKGDNQNMVALLRNDLVKLEQVAEEIAYFKKYNNENMVRLLTNDLNRLG